MDSTPSQTGSALPTIRTASGLGLATYAADGTVLSAGERGTGGLRIDIAHGDGLVTTYRHNSRLLVSPGDRVGRGLWAAWALLDLLATDALNVLDACGVARAHLCGVSLGGMIAMRDGNSGVSRRGEGRRRRCECLSGRATHY